MSKGTSIADLPERYHRQIREQIERAPAAAPEAKRAKYGNTKTPYASSQGFVRLYDSKKEANYAAMLDAMRWKGDVAWWLPQIPLPLPGDVSYRADFLVCFKNGNIRFVDVKGRDTQASINKRKQVKAIFGIDVELA